jgi:hypothetical protein
MSDEEQIECRRSRRNFANGDCAKAGNYLETCGFQQGMADCQKSAVKLDVQDSFPAERCLEQWRGFGSVSVTTVLVVSVADLGQWLKGTCHPHSVRSRYVAVAMSKMM